MFQLPLSVWWPAQTLLLPAPLTLLPFPLPPADFRQPLPGPREISLKCLLIVSLLQSPLLLLGFKILFHFPLPSLPLLLGLRRLDWNFQPIILLSRLDMKYQKPLPLPTGKVFIKLLQAELRQELVYLGQETLLMPQSEADFRQPLPDPGKFSLKCLLIVSLLQSH